MTEICNDLHVESMSMSDGKGTVAHVALVVGDRVSYGEGSSRRVKGDAYDEQLGNMLAFQRALEDALRQMKEHTRKMMNAQVQEG